MDKGSKGRGSGSNSKGVVLTVAFDFDGTIADNYDIAIEAFNKAAALVGASPIPSSEIELAKKLSTKEFFKRYRVNRLKLIPLLFLMKRFMRSKMHLSKPVPKMREVLKELKRNGHRCVLLTTNLKSSVSPLLKAWNMDGLFDETVFNARFGKSRKLRAVGADVYIGDEERDVVSAKKAGAKFIGVSWGYADPEVLKRAGADFIAEQPEDIISFIEYLKKQKRRKP